MKTRVLHADDDEQVRTFVRFALSRLDCEVTSVADGEAALARFRPEEFDVIITDHEMPRLDGLALVERLVRSFTGRIVVISGGLTPQICAAYLALGVERVEEKPVTLEQLRRLLGRRVASLSVGKMDTRNGPDQPR